MDLTPNHYNYAQNYPQLFNQAQTLALSDDELRLLKHAFDFALSFSDGVYRAQGIPLINHLVRTASIVMRYQKSIQLIVVALLHAVYVIHKFDNSARTQKLTQRRQEIIELFGDDTYRLLVAYEELHWYKKETIDQYVKNVDELPEQTKNLILIRLANELEDHLDLAMSYSVDERIQNRSFAYGFECVELADALGFHALSEELKNVLNQQKIFLPKSFLRCSALQGYEIQHKKWPMTVTEKLKKNLKVILKRK